MNNTLFLGIDISKDKFDIALLLPEGKYKTKAFRNNASGHIQLTHWLCKQTDQHVHCCMEATNVYGHGLAEHLYDAGYEVSIVNPLRIKGFAQSELQRTKSDRQDAALIARFARAMVPRPWTPDAKSIRQLRAMVRRLDMLLEMRQQEVNRLYVADVVIQFDIERHIGYLDQQIAKLRETIADHIEHNDELNVKGQLLKSIPGIGETSCAHLLAYFANIDKFDDAKKLASFCGVAPREFQSGSSINKRAKMSKTGAAQLRKALFMPAMVALRYNPILIDLKKRLLAKGKSKMLIIGAGMRKLLHIVYGVLKNNTPFDENRAKNA